MDNSKYYFVESKGDKAYPLVASQNFTKVKFGKADILEVIIRPPVPRKPVMADFLSGSKDVFDKRITDVMQSMNMEGVRFFPAEVDDTKGNIHNNYTCVYVDDNTYNLLDLEKSTYEVDDDDEDEIIYTAQRVVIDRKKLNEIPLNKRLGMRLDEAPGYTLYHQSVVDAIMALEPTGMYFQDIENYEIL